MYNADTKNTSESEAIKYKSNQYSLFSNQAVVLGHKQLRQVLNR